jgi:hypothetical protein
LSLQQSGGERGVDFIAEVRCLSVSPWVEANWIFPSKKIQERRRKGEKKGKKKIRKNKRGGEAPS